MANTKTKMQEKNSFKDGIVTYFKGVRSEWGKVTWPEKNQIIVETGIVVFVVSAFTIAVYLMDIIFKGLMGLIVK
ncbi:MAG: preprotein translocase subunit SecE [bacterium]|nr:preprotein translocase subunit SecE [bacterium]